MYLKFQVKPAFTFESRGFVLNSAIWFIPTNDFYLLGILNSKLGWFLISNFCSEIQNGYQLIYQYLKDIPIIKKENNKILAKEIQEKCSKMLALNGELEIELTKFSRMIKRKFPLEKLSKNLKSWHTLTFTEFTKELKKKKVKFSLSEEAEWEEYFETEKAKALEIKAVIDKTDREIDKMVYELYGLTEEEIAIVENS